MAVILVCQTYSPDDEKRRSELSWARELNDGMFDVVDYLDGEFQFGELVEHCNRKYTHRPCVIANADISFVDTSRLHSRVEVGRLVALTPWDNHHHPRFTGHMIDGKLYSGSQDAWAFVAGTLPAVDVGIPMGHIGCDQLIAGWALRQGLDLRDPCFDVRIRHWHAGESNSTQKPPLAGYFAYPEMGGGESVAAHHWPNSDGNWVINWELHRCRR